MVLTEEQEQTCALVRRFLADNSKRPPAADLRHVWRSAARIGLTGLCVADRYGGFSGRLDDIALVAIELGRAPRHAPRFELAVLAARLLEACAAKEAKDRLSELVEGRAVPAFGGWDGKSDWNELPVKAKPKGATLRLTGRARSIIGAAYADFALIAVNGLGGLPKVGIVLLPLDTLASVICETQYLFDGTPIADIDFADLEVPLEALVLDTAEAAALLRRAVDEAVVVMCATAVGNIDRAIEMTAEYLAIREQFGRPLAQFQALQHSVANLFITATQARSSLYSAICALQDTDNEANCAASACKVKVATAAKDVTSQAVHLHGGIGFTTEYQVGHHLRRAIIDEKLFGDVEFHLDRHVASRLSPPAMEQALMQAAIA